MDKAYYASGVPIYGGIRQTDIAVYSRDVKIGDRIEGGKVVEKYPDFVLVERQNRVKESILWKDLILGLYRGREQKER